MKYMFSVVTPFIPYWWDVRLQQEEKIRRINEIIEAKKKGGAKLDEMKLKVLYWNLYKLGMFISKFLLINVCAHSKSLYFNFFSNNPYIGSNKIVLRSKACLYILMFNF